MTCQAVTKYVPFPSLACPNARRPPRASGLPLGRPPALVSRGPAPRAASPARCPSGKVGLPGFSPRAETLVPSGVPPSPPPALNWPSCRARYAPSLCPPVLALSRTALVVSAASPRGCGSPSWAERQRAHRQSRSSSEPQDPIATQPQDADGNLGGSDGQTSAA